MQAVLEDYLLVTLFIASVFMSTNCVGTIVHLKNYQFCRMRMDDSEIQCTYCNGNVNVKIILLQLT